MTAVPSLMHLLLPALQVEGKDGQAPTDTLRLLILSGELLSIQLWKDLASAMPCTTILNLYGSTELSGDCTFFECPTFDGLSSSSKGHEVLDAAHELNSVPIGEAIDGHWLCIVLEDGKLAESGEVGELWVGGVGVANGYFDDTEATCSKFMDLTQEKDWLDLNAMGVIGYTPVDTRVRVFKTGDMAKRLLTGSIALLGRKDRQIKIHGHRIALEEIEFILEQHPQVDQAAVSLVILGANSKAGLVAYVVIPDDTVLSNSSKEGTSMVSGDVATHEGQMSLEESLIWWLKERVTAVMIPQQFIRLKAMPLTNSGKIDHSALPKPLLFQQPYISKFGKHKEEESMQGLDYVREVFAHVLMANKEVLAADNFFAMGGTSISAAHAAFVLGVNMHMIYAHPTAWQLCQAMGGVSRGNRLMCFGSEQRGVDEQLVQLQSEREKNSHGRSISLSRVSDLEAVQSSEDEPQNRNLTLGKKRKHEETTKVAQMAWPAFISKPGATAFLRCNKSVHLQSEAESRASQVQDIVLEEVPEKEDWSLQQCWRVSLQACVDASPLLVIHGDTCRIFIGSHSHNFMSVDAISGEVQWEVQLTGRVESSAAITHDFSQVKCQPTLDTWQGWIWYVFDPTYQDFRSPCFLSGTAQWCQSKFLQIKSESVILWDSLISQNPKP
jgi:acyl-CoA synthetase